MLNFVFIYIRFPIVRFKNCIIGKYVLNVPQSEITEYCSI